MTDADILLKDVLEANDNKVEANSILKVLCEALTGTKLTEEED